MAAKCSSSGGCHHRLSCRCSCALQGLLANIRNGLAFLPRIHDGFKGGCRGGPRHHFGVLGQVSHLLCNPQSVIETAQLIHQSDGLGVGPHVDLALGDLLHGGHRHASARSHLLQEVVIDGIQQPVYGPLLLGREAGCQGEKVCVLAGLDGLDIDALLLQERRDVQLEEDHPNAAGDGAGRGQDLVGGARDVVAPAGRHVAHAHNHRLSRLLQQIDLTANGV
mmetsp:Transcript_31124/g.88279  ORF Transcript_31124/g.88279 Transcript_31124/m.88279 type:complete len:222 (+) Transcript_31124:469-1134(+)